MKQLIIETSRWLRGQDAWETSGVDQLNTSRLLRQSDNKMCCLGFYLNSCGVSEEVILDEPSPRKIANKGMLPAEAEWLIVHVRHVEEPVNDDSVECAVLMRDNDDKNLTEEHRRAKVTEMFAKQDVEVIFKD